MGDLAAYLKQFSGDTTVIIYTTLQRMWDERELKKGNYRWILDETGEPFYSYGPVGEGVFSVTIPIDENGKRVGAYVKHDLSPETRIKLVSQWS